MSEAPFRFEPGHYHLHVHTISKFKKNSVLAAAAYRHAEMFRTDSGSVTHAAAYQRAQELGNDGQVFDYRRKIGVAWTGIMAPEFTPKELLNPQTLWNTVERIEHRSNARLAREMIIALPHQVNQEVHIAMLRAFINTHLVSKGMIADVAIHRPPVEHGGDSRNWHAHILLSDRPMTPSGFAATKDRMWNAKENLLLWRKAWADCHNATMEALGLPHRIDHRSLEAQRQDALRQNDILAALDLDRTPQIHVGKAAYGTHPDRTVYRERRERNRQILTSNKFRAAARADDHAGLIARADTAAYLEARRNADDRAVWQPPEPEFADLHNAYGRSEPTTTAGHIRTAFVRAEANKRVWDLQRNHGYPWLPSGTRDGAPSVFDALKPMIATTGPGHPLFTVTAKDIVFAFYGFGLIGTRQLQASLQNIAQEEQRLFADRIARKPALRPPKPSLEPQPPTHPTPHADALARRRRSGPIVEGIYLKRLEQLQTFEKRRMIGKSLRPPQRRALVVDPVEPC